MDSSRESRRSQPTHPATSTGAYAQSAATARLALCSIIYYVGTSSSGFDSGHWHWQRRLHGLNATTLCISFWQLLPCVEHVVWNRWKVVKLVLALLCGVSAVAALSQAIYDASLELLKTKLLSTTKLESDPCIRVCCCKCTIRIDRCFPCQYMACCRHGVECRQCGEPSLASS